MTPDWHDRRHTTNQPTTDLERDGAGHAAEQAGQCECSKSGRALMVLLIAGAPAALQTHQQPDRQRDGETAEGFVVIHSPS